MDAIMQPTFGNIQSLVRGAIAETLPPCVCDLVGIYLAIPDGDGYARAIIDALKRTTSVDCLLPNIGESAYICFEVEFMAAYWIIMHIRYFPNNTEVSQVLGIPCDWRSVLEALRALPNTIDPSPRNTSLRLIPVP
jgi:hypothetical protein